MHMVEIWYERHDYLKNKKETTTTTMHMIFNSINILKTLYVELCTCIIIATAVWQTCIDKKVLNAKGEQQIKKNKISTQLKKTDGFWFKAKQILYLRK